MCIKELDPVQDEAMKMNTGKELQSWPVREEKMDLDV